MFQKNLPPAFTLKMDAPCSSKTSLNIYQTTKPYIPETSVFYSHHHNLKFHFVPPATTKEETNENVNYSA
jgi:hypothetical protein